MTGSCNLNLVFGCLIFISFPVVFSVDGGLPMITVINDVTPAQAVEFSPDKLPNATIKAGADYKLSIAENVSQSCVALREDFYIAAFDYYQPSRDYGKTVYWLMNKDGIQLSWDKSTWKKIVKWTFKE